MKKTLLFSLLSLLGIYYSLAQDFQQGYIVNNNGERKDCFLRYPYLANNPPVVEYYFTDGEEKFLAYPTSIKEFGIDNKVKFVSYLGRVDMSSRSIDDLDFNRQPLWEMDTVFLKVLEYGAATLYLYKERGSYIRFFYSTEEKKIEQLVYKRFKYYNNDQDHENMPFQTSNFRIKENNAFQNQLYLYVRITNVKPSYYTRLHYSYGSLMKHFKKYNKAINRMRGTAN